MATVKAPNAAGCDGEVALFFRFEFGALLVRHQRLGEPAGVGAGQLLVGHRRELAVNLHSRRKIAGHEQAGRLFAHHQAEQVMHGFVCLFLIHGARGLPVKVRAIIIDKR